MSKIYFSAATSGFYPEELKENYEEGTGWPDDAVEITFAEWRLFSGDCPAGKRLGADEQGYPVWDDVPPPTDEELIAVAEQEKQSRLQYANSVAADWRTELSLGVISESDKAKLVLWMQYIKDVKAIDISIPDNIDWPPVPA